jgi:hypothetical protein
MQLARFVAINELDQVSKAFFARFQWSWRGAPEVQYATRTDLSLPSQGRVKTRLNMDTSQPSNGSGVNIG